MAKKGNWNEKDEASIKATIVNMINQKQLFRDLGENGELPQTFQIQNSQEYDTSTEPLLTTEKSS